tara:strand:- start:427 stop:606 length:180 start_codon:yes stop_codon:yes gene_type:complete
MESHMVWTALFKNNTALTFNTRYNDVEEAKEAAEREAVVLGTWVVAIIKGNCEQNAYFI